MTTSLPSAHALSATAPLHCLDWLAQTPPSLYPLFYAYNPETQEEIAAAGSLFHLHHTPSKNLLLSLEPGARLFGGTAFPTPRGFRGTPWSIFPKTFFFLPLLTMQCEREGMSLFSRASSPPFRSQRLKKWRTWAKSPEPKSFEARLNTPLLNARRDLPSRLEWLKLAQKTVEGIAQGKVQKLVLMRKTSYALTYPDPITLLKRLRKAGSFRRLIGFAPSPSHFFFSASPELLYVRKGADLTAEAIAGTHPRALHDPADQALRREFAQNSKERLEHDLVVLGLSQALAPLATLLLKSQRELLLLPRIQHLRTTLTAKLKENTTDLDLLSNCHPTPATAGYPVPEALAILSSLEKEERGWYAGALGWIEKDEAEFAVGIRSGLVRGKTLSLYTGAGLVLSSDLEREWEELELKLQTLTEPFSHAP